MNLIFSDGSAIRNPNKKSTDTWLCGSGTLVIVKNKELVLRFKDTHPGKANNYAELYGIYRGLKALLKHEDKIYSSPVSIITDSEYCIRVLTDTMIIEGKLKPLSQVWRTKDGSPMKNQELIKKIYKLIVDRTGDIYPNVSFIHINSHLSEKKDDDLRRIQHSFLKVGNKITKKTAKRIILLNGEVDELARKAAESLKGKKKTKE